MEKENESTIPAQLSRKDARKKQWVSRTSSERQAEIADATLRLIARHGLQGTTVSRIAREVGMEPPSLYAHFSSRQDMLLAAFDLMCDRIDTHLSLPTELNVLERLRRLGETHSMLISGEFDGFVLPTFEILTAPGDTGLREVSSQRQLVTLDTLAGLVEEGKRQGTIRPDMDSRIGAYQMMLLFWAEDVTRLMGIDEFVSEGFSGRILDLFLRDMAATPDLVSAGGAEADAEGSATPGSRRDAENA
ncbi:MAG: TetR/AcrR family transcriptional regulator [Actinomycetia bacterium]|nr:TetR/AcrR family transcriptional regulator [Actinomycetes bacterium]